LSVVAYKSTAYNSDDEEIGGLNNESAFRFADADSENRLHCYVDYSSFLRRFIYNLAGHINANNWENAWNSYDFIWLYQTGGLFFEGFVPFGISI